LEISTCGGNNPKVLREANLERGVQSNVHPWSKTREKAGWVATVKKGSAKSDRDEKLSKITKRGRLKVERGALRSHGGGKKGVQEKRAGDCPSWCCLEQDRQPEHKVGVWISLMDDREKKKRIEETDWTGQKG